MRKLFFPLLLFVSGLLSAQTEITLYVSPSGSDHHPGTAEKPMATLEYAWKKASRQAGRRSITIYCEGTNYLSAPILITTRLRAHPNIRSVFLRIRTKGGHQRFAYTPEPALERV